MKIENQVEKNTKDIHVLKECVKNNTNRIDTLEKFIVPELKTISKKIDKIKIPFFQYIGLLAMGGVLAMIMILILF